METKNELQTTDKAIATTPGSIVIDRDMVVQLKEQRAVLMEYVQSQLKKDSDYGIIPGCKKPSLWKPGAEKLRTLFNLSVTQELQERVLDIEGNFALYSYKSTVLKNGVVLAECEGTCNSQEKKYREKAEWNYDATTGKNVESKVPVPVCDILNTLQKMSQKRAFVGAILIAVGASDYFNQDFDDWSDAVNLGVTPDTSNMNKNNEPKIKTVSNKPEINHEDNFMVQAMTSYEQKDLPKGAGFMWDKNSKKWLKEMNKEQFESFSKFEIAKA